jgi:quercetin dioxygenase-like cupin family protein
MQMHREKDETLHLLKGEVRLLAGASAEALVDVRLMRGESFRIEPGTVHRIEAVTDADVLEASTPQLDDLVRLEDRYGRAADRGGA